MTIDKTTTDLPIAYRVDGPDDGDAVMLLNGLGMTLTQWPPRLLAMLHEAGMRTVCVDNRDVGRSARVTDGAMPNPYLQSIKRLLKLRGGASYRVEDMADDAASVLQHLGIARAHVIGRSMGGIIGQVLAARHPERVRSLTLFMTTTNNPRLPRPKGEAAKILFDREPPATSRTEAVERLVAKWQYFMTTDSGMSVDDLRAFHGEAFDHGLDPDGWKRQLAAIIETGDLREAGRTISAPTLIIHGTDDKLVPVAGGRDVHAMIAKSRLELIEGMGHDLPPRLMDHLNSLVLDHLTEH